MRVPLVFSLLALISPLFALPPKFIPLDEHIGILEMRHNGHSYLEIAERYGIKENNAKNRFHNFLKNIGAHAPKKGAKGSNGNRVQRNLVGIALRVLKPYKGKGLTANSDVVSEVRNAIESMIENDFERSDSVDLPFHQEDSHQEPSHHAAESVHFDSMIVDHDDDETTSRLAQARSAVPELPSFYRKSEPLNIGPLQIHPVEDSEMMDEGSYVFDNPLASLSDSYTLRSNYYH